MYGFESDFASDRDFFSDQDIFSITLSEESYMFQVSANVKFGLCLCLSLLLVSCYRICEAFEARFTSTVKPRYNAGRGRKNFEAKNRVIARSAL